MRAVGDGLFLVGLMGMIGLALGSQGLSANPVDQIVGSVFFGLLMAAGVWLRRRGTPKPVFAPRQQDGIVELEHYPRQGVRGNELGSCTKCGYQPVAFDADYCPLCAAKNPNPGVVNRTVPRALLLGAMVCSVIGASWAHLVSENHKEVATILGLLVGGVTGVILGLVGGLIVGVIARLFGKR